MCVRGLSEQELPGTDYLELEVPGMCIGGGSNIQNKGLGYILFMRKGGDAKQKKFERYQETILVPGVNDSQTTKSMVD